MKRLLCLAGVLLFGCGASESQKGRDFTSDPNLSLTIYARNETSATEAEWRTCVEALNIQLARDVRPVWGFNARVEVESPVFAHDPGRPLLVMRDHLQAPFSPAPQGYHIEWTAYVDYSLSLAGGTWQVTCSHEILEMLSERSGGPEICDPVAPYGYAVDGTENGAFLLSDFVFPSYFEKGPAPYDFLRKVQAPGVPAPGGVAR